jgi:poly-gamma-glutamate synthesis protein (capsule biosynthesis protein)
VVTEGTALRLALVGDIALGDHPKTPGFGFYSRYGKEIPGYLANRVLPSGVFPDIVFGNLEFALAAERENLGDDRCCLGTVSYIPFLRKAGFTVLNVANNHSWEYGAQSFAKTVRSLKNAGIKVVGVPDDFDPAGFLRINGRLVAVLGCSARPRQGFTAPPGYNEFEYGWFLKRIRDARRRADLVCVSIHWGDEFLTIPGPREREAGRAMIDAGADVVIGHHPHVLREVETYRNGIIAYSLGNFIGDMTWNPLTRETGCLVVEAGGPGGCVGTFFPALIDLDYFPRYLDEAGSRRFLDAQIERDARLTKDLKVSGYEFLVRKALKRHQYLTLGFVMRNFFRYRAATLGRIVSHAIRVRLQRSTD